MRPQCRSPFIACNMTIQEVVVIDGNSRLKLIIVCLLVRGEWESTLTTVWIYIILSRGR